MTSAPRAAVVRPARPEDAPAIAAIAAATFPDASPASLPRAAVDAHIALHLSEAAVAAWIADPERIVLVARDGEAIAGYAMLIRGVPDDDDVQRAVELRPAIELSKIYVLPERHGAGAAAALMAEALQLATTQGFRSVWLGVNQKNERAQRFYRKHGFAVNGTKTFRLGAGVENDYVMVRPV